MNTAKENTIQVLKKELKFVQKGGYRAPLVWRAPLVFEDSPTCPKERCSACPDTNCVLMSFVPTKCHYETVPCRHIPLNEMGETLDSLYRTGTNEEIEQTLESRLLETINSLKNRRNNSKNHPGSRGSGKPLRTQNGIHTQTEYSLFPKGFGSTSEPQLENQSPALSIVGRNPSGRVLLQPTTQASANYQEASRKGAMATFPFLRPVSTYPHKPGQGFIQFSASCDSPAVGPRESAK